MHSSSETQGQSVGLREKVRRKFSSVLSENVRRAFEFSPDPTDMHSNFPQSFSSEKAIKS